MRHAHVYVCISASNYSVTILYTIHHFILWHSVVFYVYNERGINRLMFAKQGKR